MDIYTKLTNLAFDLLDRSNITIKMPIAYYVLLEEYFKSNNTLKKEFEEINNNELKKNLLLKRINIAIYEDYIRENGIDDIVKKAYNKLIKEYKDTKKIENTVEILVDEYNKEIEEKGKKK